MSIIPDEQAFGWDDPPDGQESPAPPLTPFALWFPWAAIVAVAVTAVVVTVTGKW